MFLLVPAHQGCPRQNPESHKMVVIVVVVVVVVVDCLQCFDAVDWAAGMASGL